MGWADSTQQLPDERQFPGLIKCCRHFVAAHEQRLCFPLDSIRRPDGNYPLNAEEIIYPGMHSDVGGGYPVRDQGKSCGDSGDILSQIALHDMYLAAFDSGAPLAVYSKFVTPLIKGVSPLRIMSPSSVKEFTIANSLTKRFNIWRQTLLNTTLQGTEEMIDTRKVITPINLPRFLKAQLVTRSAGSPPGVSVAMRITVFLYNLFILRRHNWIKMDLIKRPKRAKNKWKISKKSG